MSLPSSPVAQQVKSVKLIFYHLSQHVLEGSILAAENHREHQQVDHPHWLVPNLDIPLPQHVVLHQTATLQPVPNRTTDQLQRPPPTSHCLLQHPEHLLLGQFPPLVEAEVGQHKLHDEGRLSCPQSSLVDFLELPKLDFPDLVLPVDFGQHFHDFGQLERSLGVEEGAVFNGILEEDFIGVGG